MKNNEPKELIIYKECSNCDSINPANYINCKYCGSADFDNEFSANKLTILQEIIMINKRIDNIEKLMKND